MNAQVEKYKLEQLEEDWQGKGNSLFGEVSNLSFLPSFNLHFIPPSLPPSLQVEERRLETERKLISSQVKYDTLERSHQMLKSHFKKLKVFFSKNRIMCVHV